MNYGAFGMELRVLASDRLREYEQQLGHSVAVNGFMSYLSGDGNTAAHPTDVVMDAGVAVKADCKRDKWE